MPDPRLVSRAQRAATLLERAWEQWRTTQGLEAEPLPPVSSYVGYSIEEPWGRPRVVFGVDAEDAERLAALLQTSIGFAAEGGTPGSADPGYRAPGRPAFAADRPAGPDRGYDQSLLDDVRGRIPVQGWSPEFNESREQLNGAGPVQADPDQPGPVQPGLAHPGLVQPGEPELPLDLGPAVDLGPAAGGSPRDADQPERSDDLMPPSELGLSDEFQSADDFAAPDEPRPFGLGAPHGVDAPYGVPYAGGAPYGVPYQGEPYDPAGPYGAGGYFPAGGPAAGYDATGPYRAAGATGDTRGDDTRGDEAGDAPGPDVRDDGARAGDEQDGDGRAGSVRDGDTPAQEARDGDPAGDGRDGDRPAGDGRDGDAAAGMRPGDVRPGDDRPGHDTPAWGSGMPGKHQVAGDEYPGADLRDAERPGTTQSGSPATAPGDSSPSSPGQEPPAATLSADQVPGGPAAASDPPADPASRGSITDTMAAELAGWAAGELPGQAAARLASWATAGGAVARSRRQARLGSGGTATERVS